ncbi:tetratricopeptide repeat-containing sensor histidine kinase [Salinimicrobium catena]|uniref:tetratricopeptide repeat-containing sensor histidine kinase n=1 Tax=Salinimicrobium catena TaxID=390640 RepID=UPI0015A00919|nr:tetratricopeptide repeat-containing sensor histidine kinase [Salinimicrobium catena]
MQDSPEKNDLLFELSYHFYSENKPAEFRYWNDKTFQLSTALRDTLKTAEAHWDLGNFFNRGEQIDSAFYHYRKAAHYYNIKGEKYRYARMLLNIAILQKNIKDYSNSEANTLTALQIVLPLKKHRQIYIGYNNLGILYNQLSEHDNAIEYHSKALNSAIQLSDKYLEATSLNNIGVVYEKMGLYQEGIDHYQQALEIQDIETNDLRLYAMLKDNLAYSKFKAGQSKEALAEMLESLQLREKDDHEAGIVINKLHLGEYFLSLGDTLTGKKYFLQAKGLAENMHFHRDILQSLLFLSRTDEEKSNEYLRDYINLHDSLEQNERRVRSKFARIELETDEFIAENRYLNEQRKWIIGGAGGTVFMVLLILVIWRQKSKNKKLELEQVQQKSNEEIYNLLLAQQNKLEEGRHQEKERISRELHDGILGKLFGTRLMLENLFGKSDLESLESKKKYLNDLRLIEEEIRTLSHELNAEFFSPKQSFLDVLQEYLAEQKKIGRFELLFVNEEQIAWDELSSEIKINVFRIFQEAINNVIKHADANLVSITCNKYDDRLEIVIFDNGKGFEVSEKRKGIGLKNIKSRITRLDGHLSLSSDRNGTQIELEIPIKRYE